MSRALVRRGRLKADIFEVILDKAVDATPLNLLAERLQQLPDMSHR